MKEGDRPMSERTNANTRNSKNTHRGTVVYPPITDAHSIYRMPEAVKYRNSREEYFPLHLRDVRYPEWRKGFEWIPFLSNMGFVSYATPEEAQAFLEGRGYTVEDYKPEQQVHA